MNLKNKVAVVTGSSSGIGKAIALSLSKEGAKVAVNSRKNVEGGIDVVRTIKENGGEANYIQADVSEQTGAKKLFEEAVKIFKTVDILINVAGESKIGELGELDIWDYQLKDVLMSAVISSDEFLKIKSQNLRKIVNISSIYGSALGGNTSYLAYSAAKAAINNLTVNLAKKLGSKVLVNAVAPGWTWTPPWGTDRKTEEKLLNDKLTIGRFIEPEEIAEMVIAILKNDAMTGQIITVDGGATLKDLY